MLHLEPTYLRYIYDGLDKGSIHPENAAELPDGLIGLYEEAFDERTSIVKRQKLLERFAIWALLKKEVSVAFVAEVLGESEDDIQEFISTYSSWFNSPESGKYQVYHERLKVYLLQKLSEGEVHVLHEKLILRLEQAIEAQKADEFEWYGLEFLAGHFSISGIIKGDSRLFKLGRNSDFEKRQIELSEGFEWCKSLYKKCIETATMFDKDNCVEWGVKLHLINQKEQKDWTLIQRHFDAGDIDRFDSEFEEKRNQFSLVSDNYLSYPTLLIFAFYFRLIENQFIIRSNQEKLFLHLNKIIEKHEKEKYEESMYLFDFPRLHLVIIERFYSFGFDITFLINRFNFKMSSDEIQKCLFPSEFLLNGVYDNLYNILKEFDVNEGDFFESFLELGFKYSTENLEEIIKRNGLISVDKSILNHRIQENLNPAYIIDVITKTLELEFDSFFSRNQKNLYELIEIALIDKTNFKTKKWEQYALTYLRKSDNFDYRSINFLNLLSSIPDEDLIQIGHKALNTGNDSRVSIFFGHLIKANKIDLIRIILEKTAAESTNLVLWNFLLKNHFNLESFFESTFVESKELKRIWLVNTIRCFRSEIPTKSFLEFCQYSEGSHVEIDQPEMNLDYWLPECILTNDFNSHAGIRLSNQENRLNTINNLEFIIILIAQSDVFDHEIEHFLQCRIKELIERKITFLGYESTKAIFSFLLKHSTTQFNKHFDQLIIYLNRLPTNEKYLNSLSFIYEMFEREGFKYQDIKLTDYFYKHFSDSEIPRHPDAFGDLSNLKFIGLRLKNIYNRYLQYCFESGNSYNIGNLIYFSNINEFAKNQFLVSSFFEFYGLNPTLILSELSFNEFTFFDHLQSLNIVDKNISKLVFLKIVNYPGFPSFEQRDKKILINFWINTVNIFNPNFYFENGLKEILNSGFKNDDYGKYFVIESINNENGKTNSLRALTNSIHEIDEFHLNKLGNLYFSSEFNEIQQIFELFKKYNDYKKLKYLNHLKFTAKKRIDSTKRQNKINTEISIIESNLLLKSFEFLKTTKSISEAEEEDFEHSIEHLAESENIVLLLFCSLLIHISDKKHEKKVELIKKVIQELAKAGYYDFSDDIEEYTEYEGDLIFLSYSLITAYNPPLKRENKILIYFPWRIKFVFIFNELVKKEKTISFRTKKAANGYIDYCLSKNLSITQLTELYDSCMTIGSKNRVYKIIKKILSQLELDEDFFGNLYRILKACIHFKDNKSIEMLINSQPKFFADNLINNIQSQLIMGNYTIDDFNLNQVNLELDDRINTLIELAVKIDVNTLKSQLLPILKLELIECMSTDEELHHDYIVIIGCLLYQRFGFEFSNNFVFESSNDSSEIYSQFISELIIKFHITEVDRFFRKHKFKNKIIYSKILSRLLNRRIFELDKMKKTISKFYKENSLKCLKMLFSKRACDKQLFVLLIEFKYGIKEGSLLIENVQKLNFPIVQWIHIIKQQPSKLRPELLAKIISVKKSQITPNVLNLLQDSLSINISPKSIVEVISNYSDFKQWNRIERILSWLKKEDRLEEIHNLLELSFDNNWDLRLAVFVRLIGKEKTLKVLSSKTNFISGQAIESIDKLSEIPRIVAHVHPDYFELIRHSLDVDSINSILESLKSRTTEAGYYNEDSFSNLYWTRMNVAEINRYISIYFNNSEALELLVGNFKILSELDHNTEYMELLSQFHVNYAKYDVEL
jgi:hypothetical protein